MRPAIAFLAVVVAVSGCAAFAGPVADPAESARRAPVPSVAGAFPAAPAALPDPAAARLTEALDAVRRAGRATLADCVAVAELTNEALLSGDELRLRAWLRSERAMAGLLPTVSATLTAAEQDRVPDGSSTGSSSGSTADREALALTVRQPIWRGLREVRERDVALRDAEAAAARTDALRLALRRAVARAFYGVLTAAAEVRTLEETVRIDRARIDEVKAREANGIARRTEVLLLEQDAQAAIADLERARTLLDVARTVLTELLGAELPSAPAADDAPPAALPSRADAVAAALAARPEVVETERALAAAEAGVELVRADRLPEVSLTANWYLARSGFSETTKAQDWDVTALVEVPLFQAHQVSLREREARSFLRDAYLDRSRALRAVVADVEGALARASSGAALLATYERSAALARENLDLLSEEYRHGIATNLEVLVAQTALQRSVLALERQRLASRLDRTDLDHALGRTEDRR